MAMQVGFYDWTTYWSGALEKGQDSLPPSVLRLLAAARDDDMRVFAREAHDLPYLELAVAQILFERIEYLHRQEPGLETAADAVRSLLELLISEEASRNPA